MLDHTVHDQLEMEISEKDDEEDDSVFFQSESGRYQHSSNKSCDTDNNKCSINNFWGYVEGSENEEVRMASVRISKIHRKQYEVIFLILYIT